MATDGSASTPRGAAPAFVVAGVGILLTAAYFLISDVVIRDALYLVVGAGAVVALLLRGAWERGRVRLAWVLVAAGVAGWVGGDALWSWDEVIRHVEPAFPGTADVLYLSGNVLLMFGLIRLIRAIGARDRDGLVDAGLVTMSLAALAWVGLIHPALTSDDGGVAALVAASYPLGDLMLLFVGVRLCTGAHSRCLAGWSLTTAVFSVLAADVGFALLDAGGSYATGHPIDAGWLLGYVLLAVAALHPSAHVMTTTTAAPRPMSRDGVSLLTLTWLAPAVMLAVHRPEDSLDLFVMLGLVTAVFLLVLVRFTGVVDQLHEHLRREGAVREAAEQGEARALALQQAQQQFATMTAHELRTPMTALLGSLTTIARMDDQSDQGFRDELLAMSLRQAKRLSRLAEDLLVLSSTQAEEGVAVESQPVYAPDVVREAIADLGAGPRVRCRLDSEAMAIGDHVRLIQVLTNIMRNALHYSPPDDHVDVAVARVGAEVEFTITDRGPGIEPEVQAELFRRFGHRKNTSQGLGVGLWVVGRLVEAMKGTVSVECPEGKGSTFTIRIPAADIADAAAPADAAPSPAPAVDVPEARRDPALDRLALTRAVV